MLTAQPSGWLLTIIAGTAIALLSWLRWATGNGWPPTAAAAIAASGVAALLLLIWIADRAAQRTYTGWRVEPGPALVVTYTSAFGRRTHPWRYDLTQVRIAHTDSAGRLVMRSTAARVVAWIHEHTLADHPDLATAVQAALRENGVTVTSAPFRSDEVRRAARDRAKRLWELGAEEFEREVEEALNYESLSPAPRPPWSDATRVMVFAR